MREKVYRTLAMVISAVTALLSLADGGMFTWMVLQGGSRLYMLYVLSLVGVAVMLPLVVFCRKDRPRLKLVCLSWLFVNAFVFLLLPSETYALTVAAVAPVSWPFTSVLYFLFTSLTVVSVAQTLWHKDA